jgi:AcrR family transcriptional regulator
MSAVPPNRPALRRRYEQRRVAVIDAAAALFAQRGFQATSMADLAAATELTVGGLYHYFASKDDLLLQVCDELVEPLLAAAREIVAQSDSAEARLRELMRTWLRHIEQRHDHMLVFTQERHVIEQGTQWRTIRTQRRAFERLLDDTLADCERARIVTFADRRLTMLALLGMVNYTPQWMRPRGRLSAEQVADGYCDLILGRSP